MDWISVKDRLPENTKSVLIYYDKHMSIGSYIKGQWFGIGETFPIGVTHWQMPIPPKPETPAEKGEHGK